MGNIFSKNPFAFKRTRATGMEGLKRKRPLDRRSHIREVKDPNEKRRQIEEMFTDEATRRDTTGRYRPQ